ncbi:MAG: tetratricopeptide repeat protein [Deltaproteobacteria bacterium]|jgi:tetratricopeptide (TPR) repeat protein|nr:tetratricopeptide repeat protein [Deltaproteobacteria bacterium]
MTDEPIEYFSRMFRFHLPANVSTLFDEGNMIEAIRKHRPVLEATERDRGPEHPETLDAVNTMGGLLAYVDDYEGAERMFRRALAGREKILGPEHLDTEASLCNLGSTLLGADDFRGSLEPNLRLLDFRERHLPEGHPGIACVMIDLGFAYTSLGELEKAETICSRAVEIAEKGMPRGQHEISLALKGLAETLIASKRTEDALPLLTRALKNHKSTPNLPPLNAFTLYNTLGDHLNACGDSEEAREAWRNALRVAEQHGMSWNLEAIETAIALGTSMVHSGQLANAVSLLGKAASRSRTNLGPENPRTVIAEFHLESISFLYWFHLKGLSKLDTTGLSARDIIKELKKAGVPEPMRHYFLGMQWLRPKSGGPGLPEKPAGPPSAGIEANSPPGEHPSVSAHGTPGEAVRKARTLLAARERELGPGHEDTVKARVALGNALVSEGRIDDADDAYADAHAAALKSLGPRSPAALGAGQCRRTVAFFRALTRMR